MNKNNLQLIDFSNGIRATEIQHNFQALQYQLDKERISVAGSGISYGLDFELDEFKLKISEGCLINNEGKEIYLDETVIDIEKPILLHKQDKNLVVDLNSNSILLSETPYALNRVMTANMVPVNESGVTANISNVSGSSGEIKVVSIDGKRVAIENRNMSALTLTSTYYYTAKRRDVVFIDKNYQIRYRIGITSSSPSIPELDKNEYTYILGYIEVNGMKSTLEQSRPNDYVADVTIIKEFKSVRNVYTDADNKLYLCGTPFDSIKVIHTVEPTNPTVDTFWYDMSTNKLKIWRRTDEYTFSDALKFTSSDPNHPQRFTTNIKYLYNKQQLAVYVNNKKLSNKEYEEGSDLTELDKDQAVIYSNEFRILKKLVAGDMISYSINRYDGYEEWVAINDVSQTIAEERHIWTPEMLENEMHDHKHDLQFFFFNADTQKNMLFVPGRNCLKVMINQVPLHSDQYDEITMYDAITGPHSAEIKEKLLTHYNYKDNFDPEKIHEEFENIGIGFKLNAPLDSKCYIEATATHIVNSNPLSKRFQRAATFVEEGSNRYDEYITEGSSTAYNEPIFQTTVPFRYGENQIEVFLNGRWLERNVEYIELLEVDQEAVKGAMVSKIKILPPAGIRDNDKVSYRITTTVYSYDHVDGLISGFQTRLTDIEDRVNDALDQVILKSNYIDDKIEEIESKLDDLTDIENNLDSKYIKKSDKIGKNNLEAAMYKGIAEKLINETVSVSTVPQDIDITDRGISSVDDFLLVYNVTNNRLLQRNSDYSILEDSNRIMLRVISTSVENCNLYLTGIKFNKA